MAMNISVKTTNYNILASGSVIVPYKEYLDISIDDLNFRFSFHEENSTDKKNGRFEVEIKNNEREEKVLEIKLFNMNTSLFGTPSQILQVGHYEGRILYVQFSVVSIKEENDAVQQLLFYTFYQDK